MDPSDRSAGSVYRQDRQSVAGSADNAPPGSSRNSGVQLPAQQQQQQQQREHQGEQVHSRAVSGAQDAAEQQVTRPACGPTAEPDNTGPAGGGSRC